MYLFFVLNEVVCEVEYQADGSSGTMWKQYLQNPKGFAFLQKTAMQYPTSKKRMVQDCIHYCPSSQISRNRNYIRESLRKVLTVLCTPLGWLETLYRESDKGYIAFLDADDVWKSDFFSQEVVDSLHKGYNLIGFRTYNCNGSLTRRECDSKFTAGKYIGESVSFGLYDHQHFAGMFYSFELLRKYPIKFRKGLAFGEDRLFSRECLYLAESLLLLDRPL